MEVELVDSKVRFAVVNEDASYFFFIYNGVFHPDYGFLLKDDESLVTWIGHINFGPLCCFFLPGAADEVPIDYSPHLRVRTFK
jgi:hypothetical protein